MINWQTRLQWVQRNRSRFYSESTRSAGTLVLEFARSLGDQHGEQLQQIATQLAEFVDADFADHCRIRISAAGVLTIAAIEPGRLPFLRRKWQGRIRKALNHKGIQRVVFEFSDAGIRITNHQTDLA